MFAKAHLGPRDLQRFCKVGESADTLLETAISRRWARLIALLAPLSNGDVDDDP